MPVSVTDDRPSRVRLDAARRDRARRAGVNFIALASRLRRICRTLSASAQHRESSPDVAATSKRRPLSPSCGSIIVHTASSIASSVTCAHSKLDTARSELREVQHVADERESRCCLLRWMRADRVALRIGDRAAHAHLDELRVAADGVQRRPQLVAHRREEVALRAVRFGASAVSRWSSASARFASSMSVFVPNQRMIPPLLVALRRRPRRGATGTHSCAALHRRNSTS